MRYLTLHSHSPLPTTTTHRSQNPRKAQPNYAQANAERYEPLPFGLSAYPTTQALHFLGQVSPQVSERSDQSLQALVSTYEEQRQSMTSQLANGQAGEPHGPDQHAWNEQFKANKTSAQQVLQQLYHRYTAGEIADAQWENLPADIRHSLQAMSKKGPGRTVGLTQVPVYLFLPDHVPTRNRHYIHADLSHMTLQRDSYLNPVLIFAGGDFQFANLEGSNLKHIFFNDSDLTGANLRNAILNPAGFVNAILKMADLSGTCLDPKASPQGLTLYQLQQKGFKVLRNQGSWLSSPFYEKGQPRHYCVGYRLSIPHSRFISPFTEWNIPGESRVEVGNTWTSDAFSQDATGIDHPGFYVYPTPKLLYQAMRNTAALALISKALLYHTILELFLGEKAETNNATRLFENLPLLEKIKAETGVEILNPETWQTMCSFLQEEGILLPLSTFAREHSFLRWNLLEPDTLTKIKKIGYILNTEVALNSFGKELSKSSILPSGIHLLTHASKLTPLFHDLLSKQLKEHAAQILEVHVPLHQQRTQVIEVSPPAGFTALPAFRVPELTITDRLGVDDFFNKQGYEVMAVRGERLERVDL